MSEVDQHIQSRLPERHETDPDTWGVHQLTHPQPTFQISDDKKLYQSFRLLKDSLDADDINSLQY